ncbi:uncharacterized protein LOC113316631 [Papaver somniferum]|uniref:uncharacterized protein LOC113316631 n=1 Tax=Papaver somniferum TaxID=3469 RepID=UPI000E6F513C|nr:uncharacterized protein LOC113316631 [Papaver somniferum]
MDVVYMVTSFFESKHILKQINHNFITLIPKNTCPKSEIDFRLISLCNVAYKIISKLLASRIKKLLPRIIDPSQTTFISRRLIQENIIISHEMIDSLKKTKDRDGDIAIKLDMSKDFDRVEWYFLIANLKSLGFCNGWCKMIEQCISTLSTSILLNGAPGKLYYPQRGLRQGDPLSPYLFILCMEALSRSLRTAEKPNLIHGFQVTKASPAVSHLFFADDCLIFIKDRIREANKLASIIDQFSKFSGQAGNFEKSSLAFRVPGMCSTSLFQAGGGVYPKKWLDIALPKALGGLNINRNDILNLALLTKLAWRMINQKDDLWVQIFACKYFVNVNPLNDMVVQHGFWDWRGICHGIEIVKKHYVWKIGDDESISIWKDSWIPKRNSPPPTDFYSTNTNKVSQLIDKENNQWNLEILNSLFDQDLVKEISSIRIPLTGKDRLRWEPSHNGIFTVKTAYRVILDETLRHQPTKNNLNINWKAFWNLKVPPRIQNFLWKPSFFHHD